MALPYVFTCACGGMVFPVSHYSLVTASGWCTQCPRKWLLFNLGSRVQYFTPVQGELTEVVRSGVQWLVSSRARRDLAM
jgi:hypothetical protein